MAYATVVVASETATLIDDVVHARTTGLRRQMLLAPFFIVDGHRNAVVTHWLAVVLGLAWVVVPGKLVTGVLNALRCPLLVERLAVIGADDTCHDRLQEEERSGDETGEL